MRVPASPEQLRRLESIHSVRRPGWAGVCGRPACALFAWGWAEGAEHGSIAVCFRGRACQAAAKAPAGVPSVRLDV